MDYKELLISSLKEKTFCRLQPSKIHGVGVFAIKKIPKNTDPFLFSFHHSESFIRLTKDDLIGLDEGVMNMLDAYSADTDDEHYDLPAQGINRIMLENYINSSKDFNLNLVEAQYSEFYRFIANRDIEIGEELTLDIKEYKVN